MSFLYESELVLEQKIWVLMFWTFISLPFKKHLPFGQETTILSFFIWSKNTFVKFFSEKVIMSVTFWIWWDSLLLNSSVTRHPEVFSSYEVKLLGYLTMSYVQFFHLFTAEACFPPTYTHFFVFCVLGRVSPIVQAGLKPMGILWLSVPCPLFFIT